MKIGILTQPLRTNYGGILQAYALQTVLERMGHEVVVLDPPYHKSLPLWKMPLSFGKRTIKKMLGRKSRVFFEWHYNREYSVVSQHTQPFIDKHIHRIEVNDLRTLNENDFDAIVVGSDQIWRPKYYRKIKNAYLAFATDWDIKRVAYAASFGTEDWEYTPKQTKQCGQLLQKFDAISVRESFGVKMCHKHFGVDALHLLDPTMLLDADDYKQLIKETNITKNKGNLACYFLDETPTKKSLVGRLTNEMGLIPFQVNSRIEDWSAPIKLRIQPPVEQWLQSFCDAEFIVTDSFHGCVFAILFNKPFVVVANEKRGLARIVSLLEIFGLKCCMYSEKWMWNDVTTIDWNDVNAKLTEWRNKSFKFLNHIK